MTGMYRDTVTLFNLHDGLWRASVLQGVDLNADRAAIIAKYGADCKDRARLHVRYQVSDGNIVVRSGETSYAVLEPRQYSGEEGTIAFRPASTGEVVDFFLAGEWDGDTTVEDSEYESGFYDYMNGTRDGVYTITEAARYSVIPHFEITGR